MFKRIGPILLVLSMAQAQALEVHEWGTFTSMVDSQGELMGGMHHEEEGLPGFVYGLRAGGLNSLVADRLAERRCPRGEKCGFLSREFADVLPYNQFNTHVSQKMETPVIYFYGQKGEKAHVSVKFPEGMISQWFPKASDYNLHLEKFNSGYMSWDVTLKDPAAKENFLPTREHSIWNPARETKANVIQVEGGEEERFIFYRGLGDFTVPLKLSLIDLSNGEVKVTLVNQSSERVPALFYVRSEKEAGIKRLMALPSIEAYGKITFVTNRGENQTPEAIKEALINAGLFADEAQSMLNTWNKSYFHTEGDRILYVLPNAWTERILPLKVTPIPQKLVRVLVGRIELFSEADQDALMTRLQSEKASLKEDHLLEAKLNTLKNKKRFSSQVEALLQELK